MNKEVSTFYKFEQTVKANDTAPKLTEMIDFYKNNHKLSKYNVE